MLRIGSAFSFVAFALIAAFSPGCGTGDESTPPPARQVVAAGTGVVTGVVKFDGVPPTPKLIPEAEAAKCHPAAKPVYDESLVVDTDGGMQNVVVYIESGPNVDLPATKPTLDQSGCRYTPHVLAVRAGTPVNFRSSDPIQHNVHAMRPAKNKPFSLPFTSAGQERPITFAAAEFSPPIEIRCDVHQWMRAYVAVFDHPFFAVTGEGGRFEIKGLPPGEYTLVAWHEKYPAKRLSIRIGEASRSKVDGPTAEFRFGK